MKSGSSASSQTGSQSVDDWAISSCHHESRLSSQWIYKDHSLLMIEPSHRATTSHDCRPSESTKITVCWWLSHLIVPPRVTTVVPVNLQTTSLQSLKHTISLTTCITACQLSGSVKGHVLDTAHYSFLMITALYNSTYLLTYLILFNMQISSQRNGPQL